MGLPARDKSIAANVIGCLLGSLLVLVRTYNNYNKTLTGINVYLKINIPTRGSSIFHNNICIIKPPIHTHNTIRYNMNMYYNY